MAAVSLQSRIKDDIAQIIRDLNLGNLAGGIENLFVADESNIQLPCVMLTLGDAERATGGTLESRFRTYTVRVFIYDDDAQNTPESEDKYMVWRQTMMDALHQRPRTGSPKRRLPNCPEVNGLVVNPKAVVDDRLPQLQKIMSGFTVEASASIGR